VHSAAVTALSVPSTIVSGQALACQLGATYRLCMIAIRRRYLPHPSGSLGPIKFGSCFLDREVGVSTTAIAEQVSLAIDTAKMTKVLGLTPPGSGYKIFTLLGRTFDADMPYEYVNSFAIRHG
jgi:hypothetical protein